LSLLESGTLGELPKKQSDLVNLAHRNSERLIHLVNDILDVEKLSDDGVQLDLQPLELSSLLNEVLAKIMARRRCSCSFRFYPEFD